MPTGLLLLPSGSSCSASLFPFPALLPIRPSLHLNGHQLCPPASNRLLFSLGRYQASSFGPHAGRDRWIRRAQNAFVSLSSKKSTACIPWTFLDFPSSCFFSLGLDDVNLSLCLQGNTPIKQPPWVECSCLPVLVYLSKATLLPSYPSRSWATYSIRLSPSQSFKAR